MTYCNYIEMSRDIIYQNVYKDKKTFFVLVHILLSRDCDTNSMECTYRTMDCGELSEEDIKKSLFRLKKEGVIELYKGSRKRQIIIALRKNDDIYHIGDFELHLDDSLVIPLPKSYSRSDRGYGKFRKSVLKRDGYKCQLCGSKENLEVHHKKSYAKYPRLRTSVSNGITLCSKCHDKVHRKGRLA